MAQVELCFCEEAMGWQMPVEAYQLKVAVVKKQRVGKLIFDPLMLGWLESVGH
jgi:hypothetical protein